MFVSEYRPIGRQAWDDPDGDFSSFRLNGEIASRDDRKTRAKSLGGHPNVGAIQSCLPLASHRRFLCAIVGKDS